SPAEGSEKLSAHTTALNPEATSSGSSIASKLIPALLIFAIPLFLGIAYKYSLFGFDKRVQRQNLREKLKKIKKKMTNYV
ncbi:Plasmodium variant antigen protein Cir/Yir/Bir, putative, partial [Plasmodium chabaudi adami]